MKYNFDQIISRKETHSTKWLKFSDAEVIPMWIADMDFLCPPEITQPMTQRIDEGIFGYTDTPQSLTDTFIEKTKQNTGWQIENEWVVWVPGGVVGLNIACKTVLAPGDMAMVPSPIYAPFSEAPENMERGFVKTYLNDCDGRLTFDFDAIRTLLTEDTKLLFLCNPHNPGGSVFTTEELSEISSICEERGIIVCSDEIHSDLVLEKGLQHIPFASLNNHNKENSITILGPCKTYNLAGFPIAAAVIPNPELREDFIRNTKVVDLITSLNDYGTDITIHDPWADEDEVMHEYALKSFKSVPKGKFDAIVLTVSHDKFKELDFLSLKKQNAVIYDVKNFLDKDITDASL